MDLTSYYQALRDDLMAAAAIGDDQFRRAAAALTAALEPATRLAMMNALSDFAAEVTAALDDTVVDVRLDGRDVKVTVTRSSSEQSGPGRPSHESDGEGPEDKWVNADQLRRAMQEAGGELSRTTIRLFNDLKSRAERAASDEGVSLNTYIQRAVSDAVRTPGHDKKRPHGRSSRNVSGFIQT